MTNLIFHLGLKKPDPEPQDMNAMRLAIRRAELDSSIIYNCLVQARHLGLSGEDTYTLLSYHALRALEDVHSRLMDLMNRLPNLQALDGKEGLK
jgi:hypothetical protein